MRFYIYFLHSEKGSSVRYRCLACSGVYQREKNLSLLPGCEQTLNSMLQTMGKFSPTTQFGLLRVLPWVLVLGLRRICGYIDVNFGLHQDCILRRVATCAPIKGCNPFFSFHKCSLFMQLHGPRITAALSFGPTDMRTDQNPILLFRLNLMIINQTV